MTVLQLSNPLSKNNTLTGGKGSSLSKMISTGLSVPDGFVLTTEAFSFYSKLNIDTLPSDFVDQTIKAFENLDAEYVAVRSSANCEDGADNSFAGQFDSFLNTTKDNLIENILKCWDSINSPRCQEYLKEKGIKPESVKVAVVVQKMIQSEVSGIAFTINPVTNDTQEIMIEAGYGLGEAIVSGQITPDNYLVNKLNLSPNEKSISDQSKKLVLKNKQNTWLEILQTSSTQQKLSDDQIVELSKICLEIETYYNHPCDIEWAFANDKFFVTQSRPVTTLVDLTDTEINNISNLSDETNFDNFIFEFQQRNQQPVLMGDIWSRAMLGNLKTEIDLPIDSNIDYIFSADNKAWIDKVQKQKILDLVKEASKNKAYYDYIFTQFYKRLDEINDTVRKTTEITDLTNNLQIADLWKEIDNCLVRFVPWYYIPWYITEENFLTDRLEKKIDEHKQDLEKIANIDEILSILTAPNKKTKFQLEEESFIRLLDNINEPNYEDFLDDHLQKYAFSTTYLLLPLEPLTKNELKLKVKQAMELGTKNEYLKQSIANKTKLQKQEKLLEFANKDKDFLEYAVLSRELGFFLTAGVEDSFEVFSRILPFMKEISRHIGIDYPSLILLRTSEILDLLENPKKLTEINLDERKLGYFMMQKDGIRLDYFGNEAVEMTKVLNKQKNPLADTDISEIRGRTAQKGKVTGKVFIALTAQDASKITDENILVTSMTTPDYVPAMKKSLAIITDEGGMLCHAAIISRELGVPCIIATKNATQILKDGDLVEVNADDGVIRVIEKAKNKQYNPHDFITLFSGKSMPVLLSDLFLIKYSEFGTLSMQTDGTWITYLPKATQKKSLKTGAKLYTDERDYLEYKTEFDKYKHGAEKKLNSINSKNILTAGDLEEFFKTAADFWLYYPKTEFFYTDNIDLDKMIPSIHEFDKLKLDGRKFLNKMSFEEDGFVQTLIKKLSKQLHIDFDNLIQYSVSELTELLKTGGIVSQEELEKRESYFSDGINNIYSIEADSLVKPFIENYLAPSKVIHGYVAYKGVVKGYARILNPDYTDFESISRAIKNMNQGDILVAQSTSPEIIPAIKKASAIITNQGGVLSHAAIIAREFKIPCIIGTDKDVTQVIKDGDLVEVDATNGIVTILR